MNSHVTLNKLKGAYVIFSWLFAQDFICAEYARKRNLRLFERADYTNRKEGNVCNQSYEKRARLIKTLLGNFQEKLLG